uniref:Uncharacterized protein n=1 Tax=Thermofilum pendens TaxID=2269 RepID=A0A7C4FDU8_THEPE
MKKTGLIEAKYVVWGLRETCSRSPQQAVRDVSRDVDPLYPVLVLRASSHEPLQERTTSTRQSEPSLVVSTVNVATFCVDGRQEPRLTESVVYVELPQMIFSRMDEPSRVCAPKYETATCTEPTGWPLSSTLMLSRAKTASLPPRVTLTTG